MWCSVVFPRNRIEASRDAGEILKVSCLRRSRSRHRVTGLLAVAAALALGGCSADITRFDSTSFGLGADNSVSPPSSPRSAGSGGVNGLSTDPGFAPSGNSTYTPPRASRPVGEVKMSALPEPAGAPPLGNSEPRRPAPIAAPAPESTPAFAAPSPAAQAPASVAKGEMIEVQQGDTLYGLSKKHRVSISELMTVNELKGPALRPGQKLHLPAGKRVAGRGPQKPLSRHEMTAGAPFAGKPATVARAEGNAGGNWQGSYTIKSGDSLYAISRRLKVQLAELQSANGIADPRKVKPGTVIMVPGGDNEASASLSAPPATAAAAASAARDEAPRGAGSPQPTIINAPQPEQRVASIGDTAVGASDTAPAPVSISAGKAQDAPAQVKTIQVAAAAPVAVSAARSGLKLRWPVKGKVIASFGPRTDGTHNDGVNLSVPLGSEVHAAEAGTVAYAGSELKGYGNLILIRHDNGWVTAYAHNDQLLVKRGDKIRRGQVVAKAGKTGTVDQPQVHFELREGSKPIDPTPHMEKL